MLEDKKEVVKNGRSWQNVTHDSSHKKISSLRKKSEKEEEKYDFKVKRCWDSKSELYVLKRRLKQAYLEEATESKKKKKGNAKEA